MSRRKAPPVVAVLGTGSAVSPDVVSACGDQIGGRRHPVVERRELQDRALIEGTGLARRDLKKMDRMAMLAVLAARSALDEAALSVAQTADCGIITGNAVAGWSFTEPQLRSLYREGLNNISPYLASAWFPAASQGQIAIHMKLLGYAKTIATDRCAGTQAIGIAANAIRLGRAARILAGAAEAPLTPFVEGAARHAGGLDSDLVEGAAYLVLGEADPEHTPIAELVDRSTFTLPLRASERLALCTTHLADLYDRNRRIGDQVDLMIDSRLSADRDLVDRVHEHSWLHEVHWNAVVRGDALAATGPLTAVSLCRKYATASYGLPAIVFSLGRDFGSAILLGPPH
jgi:hypothetical protein